MAEEMQEDEPDSPLKVKLGKLANQISRFGYIGAVVIAVLYLVHFVILAGGASAFLQWDLKRCLQNCRSRFAGSCYYCMCRAGRSAIDDFTGTDAEYQ